MADTLLQTLTTEVATQLIAVLQPLKNEYEPTSLTVSKKALAKWLDVDVSKIDTYMNEEYFRDHVYQQNFAGKDARYYVDQVRPWLFQRPTHLD
ncbi:hypothetical protein EQG49_12675 [Periweissella cryptocerci]|uniref:Uncharacterized protein n=1 Tax=Periweissella cryptocerci TaxID=2506420 RepID=A0A4P6YWL9_9LACO|nr:hypothetical protein [Periweissella cryptocerci]QBO37252.1 hypothetical protein EQG49_12675 [Periweissella cryptocerci]